jgi:hypothetical protein
MQSKINIQTAIIVLSFLFLLAGVTSPDDMIGIWPTDNNEAKLYIY